MNKDLVYLCKSCLILGSKSFGGYMALVSMARDKFVNQDKRVDDSVIAEGLSLASMIPGPIAVNVISYIGFRLAGIAGALISIISILIPSFFLVLLLSILYIHYQNRIDFESIMKGILPVIVAIIISVAFTMSKNVCKRLSDWIILVASAIALFTFKTYGVIVTVLLLAFIAGNLLPAKEQSNPSNTPRVAVEWRRLALGVTVFVMVLVAAKLLEDENIVAKIFLVFSQVSLTLFGGGYVMVPILKVLIVDQLQWLDQAAFNYGISIGQITPGPILISSVFFGYSVSGVVGSIVATLGIFLPSAFLMIILSQIYVRFISNPIVRNGVSGIKPAVAGMILYSGISLFMHDLTLDYYLISISLAIFVTALISLIRFKVNSLFLILGGGLLGYLLQL